MTEHKPVSIKFAVETLLSRGYNNLVRFRGICRVHGWNDNWKGVEIDLTDGRVYELFKTEQGAYLLSPTSEHLIEAAQ